MSAVELSDALDLFSARLYILADVAPGRLPKEFMCYRVLIYDNPEAAVNMKWVHRHKVFFSVHIASWSVSTLR